MHWRRVILDEAHEIRNPLTLIHNVCMRLKAYSKIAATGTPINNKLEDLVSILKWIGLYDADPVFFEQMMRLIAQKKNNMVYQIIRQLLSLLLIRRLKDDVIADKLPNKEDIRVQIKMNESDSLKYQEIKMKAQ